jgi:hypothetical protein
MEGSSREKDTKMTKEGQKVGQVRSATFVQENHPVKKNKVKKETRESYRGSRESIYDTDGYAAPLGGTSKKAKEPETVNVPFLLSPGERATGPKPISVSIASDIAHDKFFAELCFLDDNGKRRTVATVSIEGDDLDVSYDLQSSVGRPGYPSDADMKKAVAFAERCLMEAQGENGN